MLVGISFYSPHGISWNVPEYSFGRILWNLPWHTLEEDSFFFLLTLKTSLCEWEMLAHKLVLLTSVPVCISPLGKSPIFRQRTCLRSRLPLGGLQPFYKYKARLNMLVSNSTVVGATTLSIKTFSILTLSIKGLYEEICMQVSSLKEENEMFLPSFISLRSWHSCRCWYSNHYSTV